MIFSLRYNLYDQVTYTMFPIVSYYTTRFSNNFLGKSIVQVLLDLKEIKNEKFHIKIEYM